MAEKTTPSPLMSELRSSGRAVVPDLPSEVAASVKALTPGVSLRWIPSTPVRDLCGGISDMTLWRWSNDTELGFPAATYIARRRYWREADILAWLEAQAAKTAA